MTSSVGAPRALVAPDKFRGTVTAREAAVAMAGGVSTAGWEADQIPLADGGEGLLEVLDGLGGTSETTEVEGPLGAPVAATWLRSGRLAVVEMARASGLMLAGGAEGNDPMAATTRGTGQLVSAIARSMASTGGTIVVGLGGSATTDGGVGALEAIVEGGGLHGVDLVGACDVSVGFVDAATRFGAQKGADDGQIRELEDRLRQVAARYRDQFGIDVLAVEGAGAAGGLGGAFVALGGTLRSGYRVVTELVGFADALAGAQLVVTGEGAFDATSLAGKVVGSVLGDADRLGVPSLVIAGRVSDEARAAAERRRAHVVSLTERFGAARALSDTAACIEEAAAEFVRSSPGGPG
jgi:glycerate 2-kinase